MSIPPLVCSTPPPPDQCEDDKDPEDFDLHYNLSQEDDDNENNDFGFGNLSTFTTHTSESNKSPAPLSSENKIENIVCDNIDESINKGNTNQIPDLPLEDDVNIEDLNLIINDETINSSTKSNQEISDINSDDKIMKDLQTNIPQDSNNESQDNSNLNIANEDNPTEILGQVIKSDVIVNEIVDSPADENDAISNDNEMISNSNLNCDYNKDDVLPEDLTYDNNLKTTDDDFEDFEDFKFVPSGQSQTVIDSTDPWGGNTLGDVGFGEFTANFETANSSLYEPVFVDEKSSETKTNIETKTITDDDDDFGDFDEFKSSATEDKASIEPFETVHNQQITVLNFQSSSENQIIESINKVIESIFPEEISETEKISEHKLEVSMGETWSYLKETDTRQPYIVNWNNSLAQKTLLRALCIDSRNILFGPKWSFSTPKYAANLSAAPLQPQKQTTQTNIHQNEQSADTDKTSTKTSWVDPFTSDGQESCNVENESNVNITGPTDLDVFEAPMSTKPDKIFSSTLNIQPIRQISLPDTHIFTPTDSETPRSKTIHYDNSTTHNILLPQPVPSVMKDQPEDFPSKPTDNNIQNDDDYWDFQDFRGNSDNNSPSLDKKLETPTNEIKPDKGKAPKANYSLETQVLQPIKLEPLMPTLNWPDPGEVKETFDDFSDFISKEVAVDEKPDPLTHDQQGFDMVKPTETLQTTNENRHFKETNVNKNKEGEHVADDFDMFQSALPTTTSVTVNHNNSETTKTYQLFHQNTSNRKEDFEPTFSKTEQIKSDNISILNARPTENVTQKIGSTSDFDELNVKPQSSGLQTTNFNLLQPTSVSSTIQQDQQKTGQILQPLSLESYSQINWPNPGIDLQDLSRFNPVESLQSFKSDASNHSKNASPICNQKVVTNSQVSDEDIWGEFVSSKPKLQQTQPKKQSTFADDDEWTDFVSSPSVNTPNGVNTISLNVHTNSSNQKSSSTKYPLKNKNMPLDIPTLNYITPKTANQKSFNERHFQNL